MREAMANCGIVPDDREALFNLTTPYRHGRGTRAIAKVSLD